MIFFMISTLSPDEDLQHVVEASGSISKGLLYAWDKR